MQALVLPLAFTTERLKPAGDLLWLCCYHPTLMAHLKWSWRKLFWVDTTSAIPADVVPYRQGWQAAGTIILLLGPHGLCLASLLQLAAIGTWRGWGALALSPSSSSCQPSGTHSLLYLLGGRDICPPRSTIIYLVHCRLGSLGEADWQGLSPYSHPLAPGGKGPPIAPKVFIVQPRTVRYLVIMGGQQQTLQKSWWWRGYYLAGDAYAQLLPFLHQASQGWQLQARKHAKHLML